MRVINRSAIVVRFREPYLRWAAGIDAKASEHAQDLHAAISIYLLPEDPADEQESAPIEQFSRRIFEQELEDWCLNESLWPKDRNSAMFREWFDVAVTSVVTDLGEAPLKIEEL